MQTKKQQQNGSSNIINENKNRILELITAEGETLSCQLKEIHLPPNIAQ